MPSHGGTWPRSSGRRPRSSCGRIPEHASEYLRVYRTSSNSSLSTSTSPPVFWKSSRARTMIALSASAISFGRARLFVSNITLRYLVLHSLEFAMIRHRSPEGESGRGCVVAISADAPLPQSRICCLNCPEGRRSKRCAANLLLCRGNLSVILDTLVRDGLTTHGSSNAVRRDYAPASTHLRGVIFECRAAKETDLIVLAFDSTVGPGETMGT